MRAATLAKARRDAFGFEPAPLTAARPAPPMPANDDTAACRAFAALANPTRQAILRRLTGGEAPAYLIADHFELGLQSIYKHIRVLRHAKLIVQRFRGREKWYSIDAAELRRARALIATMLDDERSLPIAGPLAPGTNVEPELVR
jgi:DNA-binding transcriptional ArsR family regulator